MHRTTLARFLAEERGRRPRASADLDALVLDVASACAAIAHDVAAGALGTRTHAGGVLGTAGRTNTHGEVQQRLDVIPDEHVVRATERSGRVAGLASEERAEPHTLPAGCPRGEYLLVFDPLDGSSNIDVNVSVGSIFSVLRAVDPGRDPAPADYLRAGSEQVCAGYALYGPRTLLVLTLGSGVHEFTLDRRLGEFVRTRSDIRIPAAAAEFAINASNQRFWEPAVQRYVAECLAGRSGPRHKDFNTRWVASLVAEAHRILTRGGVFLDPLDSREPATPGRLRLLYEANPVAMLVEQAGGAAGTGRGRVLDIVPDGLHQRVPFVFGARDEVERIERYHREQGEAPYDSPLYATRGLFRAATR